MEFQMWNFGNVILEVELQKWNRIKGFKNKNQICKPQKSVPHFHSFKKC